MYKTLAIPVLHPQRIRVCEVDDGEDIGTSKRPQRCDVDYQSEEHVGLEAVAH
jgi:hypothetical protein